MNDFNLPTFDSVWHSFVALLYVVFVWLGFGILKGLRFLAPKAGRIIINAFSAWIAETLEPVIKRIVDKEIDEKINPSLKKIQEATHGKKEKEDAVYVRLLEVAERLEAKNNEKK